MINSVHIGEYDYEVKLQPEIKHDDTEYLGWVDYGTTVIDLSLAEHEQLRSQTLVHEIIHVIMHQAGFSDHSEAVIEALSHGLIQVIRENPELIEFIKQKPVNSSKIALTLTPIPSNVIDFTNKAP